MSSDDGIDYHKSLQHHHHHHHHQSAVLPPQQQGPALSLPATSSSCSLSIGNVNGGGAVSMQHQQQQSSGTGGGAMGRRKSSLSYQHQLQQQQHAADTCGGGGPQGSDMGGGGATAPGGGGGGGGGTYVSMVSPSRYSLHQPEGYHHIGGRLSIHPIERYEDTMTCCLPPPSPAPTSDRFIMGIPSPSSYSDPQNQNQPQSGASAGGGGSGGGGGGAGGGKYSNTPTMHRTMSPSSRLRLSERYRDASPKCDRFVTTTHFLANSTPLVSNDTYTYLSSTVHTPVKRYVPTPPPPTEIYSDIPQSSSSTSSNSGYHTVGGGSSHHQGQHQQHQQQHQNQQNQQGVGNGPTINTLPYRFRMKCCLTEQGAAPASLPPGGQSASYQDRIPLADHYATPPRVRPLKCAGSSVATAITAPGIVQQQVSSTTTSAGVLLPQGATRQNRSGGGAGGGGSSSVVVGDYMPRTPSVEYLGSAGGRVVTPVSIMSEPATGTCLHCNTIRRTTGVHQTTQTTGPISPVPQQQQSLSVSSTGSSSGGGASQMDSGAGTDLGSTASPTPSMNPSQMSPLSPPIQLSSHQEQQNEPQISCATSQQQMQQQQQQQQQVQQVQQVQQMQHVVQQQAPPQSQQQSAAPPSMGGLSAHSMGGRSLQQSQPQPQPHHHQHNPQQQQQQSLGQPLRSHHGGGHHKSSIPVPGGSLGGNGGNSLLTSTAQRSTLTIRQQMQQRFSRKQRLKEYVRREIARFFGVDTQTEEEERLKWFERQRRLALRRFGPLKTDHELAAIGRGRGRCSNPAQQIAVDRPDILPAQTTDEPHHHGHCGDADHYVRVPNEKKASVPTMIVSGLSYIVQTLNKRQQRVHKQWSRSFAPSQVTPLNGDNPSDVYEGLTSLTEEEVFFDSPGGDVGTAQPGGGPNSQSGGGRSVLKIMDHPRQIYMGERVHGWRTSAAGVDQQHHQQQPHINGTGMIGAAGAVGGIGGAGPLHHRIGYRGTRISSQLLDGVLDNSRRPISKKVKLFREHELDDRNDHRPFFTYWINTVQILVLVLSLTCYGIGPIGIGIEQKSGQVLVTSLSLQTVQHQEQRNVWIGPRVNDLVHLGAKFAACMRRDVKIMEVIAKTRRQERETACCIRNDDSGCVQSSQADCSVRGLWPTKSISTWKKWSPGESGPGGRISGSVCGLDPKYCDAPASIAPYEWPDDITKWPICRKTNSFSQRFRFKDHTAEHMVCEVIGHPCCTGVFGECRITTREYCDFVKGYFHEEASLCSQVSCLNNVCGMFPFFSAEVPDQFYRLFTSLCLHAGILHLAITVAFQHVFLADLERLIGPIRTAIVYIGSGLAGNLTSAIFVPYKPEVGPLASLAGVVSSLGVLLLLIHWKQLKKPYIALIKLIIIAGTLFGMGTLPWQQNFTGLMAGVFCGIFLTIALVPFVTITKYGRKTKINLIWACVLFHVLVYTIMFVIFYIFPTEFTSFNFGDVLNSGMTPNGFESTAIAGSSSSSGNGHGTNQQQHHHLDDMVRNMDMSKTLIGKNAGNGPFSSTYDGTSSISSNSGGVGGVGGVAGGAGGGARTQQQMLHRHHALEGSSKTIVSCTKGTCLSANSKIDDPTSSASISNPDIVGGEIADGGGGGRIIIGKNNGRSEDANPSGGDNRRIGGGSDSGRASEIGDAILRVSNAINQHIITA